MRTFFLSLLSLGIFLCSGCGGQKEFDALLPNGQKVKVYADYEAGTYQKVDSNYIPVFLLKGSTQWEYSEYDHPSSATSFDTLIEKGEQRVIAWAKVIY